jgi:hypothetical protein
MKKTVLILAVVATVLAGCNTPKHYDKYRFENSQQQQFNDFLAVKQKMSHGQVNDIKRKEFYNQFEKELFNYIDSVRLFVNWEGYIDDIKTEESDKTIALKFKISFLPEKSITVQFFCTHLVETDSLNSDYLYNTVKNMPNGLIVYFDGFIRTKNKGEIYYHLGASGHELNLSSPDYEFWIIDVGPERRSDTLSTSLQNAIDFNYKVIEPLKLQYLNKISKSESDKRHKSLLPTFKILQSKLTNKEKQYCQRLSTCLVYNFLYGD